MRKQKVNPKKLGFSKAKNARDFGWASSRKFLWCMQWQLIFQARRVMALAATSKERKPFMGAIFNKSSCPLT